VASAADGYAGRPYRLLMELGSGAMGRVFLAADDDAGRQVAVKVVRADLAGAPMFRKRFARELDVAQRVRGLPVHQ